MSSIKFFKVTSLPAVLEPNSVYFVNTAGILSMYVTDKDGVSSLQLSVAGTGTGDIPNPVRKESPKIVGDIAQTALGTALLITRRLYMIPFITSRSITLTNLRMSVVAGSNGTVSLGIYDNVKLANGNDNPGNLLASVTGLNSSGNQNRDGPITFTFQPNTLYWVALMPSAAPTLRGVAAASIQGSLGRVVSTNNGVSHLYKDYTVFGLPTLGPTDLLSGTGNIPAIYLVE